MCSNGKLLSSADGSLQVIANTTYNGTDNLGDFLGKELTWSSTAGEVEFKTRFRLYSDFLVFEQYNVYEISSMGCGGKNTVATAFPSFVVQTAGESLRRGTLAFDGDFLGHFYKSFEWGEEDIPSGIAGTAPIVVFSQDLKASCVLSPASNFMVANQYYSSDSKTLIYGIMGSIEALPADFSMQTILTLSGHGVNRAMMRWGEILLNKYGKDRSGHERDMTLNYLGYSTDNGAFYYYYTQPGKNYEETIIDVKVYADSVGLPYRYWLADSWWYYKGLKDGVKNWTAMGSIFPHGLDYVYNKTGWPVVGHNRMWAADTDYAKQNGGRYDFAIDSNSQRAVPLTQDFWDMLMESSRKWGLYTYEQDWLDVEFQEMNALYQNATLGRTWLQQMGAAAAKNGLTIQYCMAYARHAMQSVELAAVTQARVSDDYSQGASNQWHNLGTTAMFAWALGLAPSKDSFWSTQNQEHGSRNPGYHGRHGEPYMRIQSAVITLSHGPIAISDEIGKSDVSLVMRSCMADGTLLQLHQPAFALDTQFLQNSLRQGGPKGEVWSGFSRVGGMTYAVLFAASLQEHYVVTPTLLSSGFGAEFEYVDSKQEFIAFEVNSTNKLIEFSSQKPITVRPKVEGMVDSPWDFTYHWISPVYSNKWAFLGEFDKWISVSEDRFTDVASDPQGLIVTLRGSPGEKVVVAFKVPDSPEPKLVSCIVPQSSTLTVVSWTGACTDFSQIEHHVWI